ncbi:MAG: M67 family metallopeptidase [Thaumarchaeota archaeon]|nr:M67 family metallopeptidase [Nitrososphaerota archaeon]
MQKTITLTKNQKQILIEHAVKSAPNESCALLFGNEDSNTCTVKDIFLTENTEKSPINFTISNEELLAGYKEAERNGLDVIGIFHSHPHSEARPSMTDKKFMTVNPVIWMIFSNIQSELNAFVLESDIIPVKVEIT